MSHARTRPKPAYSDYSVVERAPPGIDRSQLVSDRANDLLSTGKYPTRAAALKAAEKDVPADNPSAQAAWDQHQAIARERQAAQDKFVTDLHKLGYN